MSKHSITWEQKGFSEEETIVEATMFENGTCSFYFFGKEKSVKLLIEKIKQAFELEYKKELSE